MKDIYGVIWDMDGVLVDTGTFHYQSWCETLAEYGFTFSYETFRKTFGMNNEGLLRRMLGQRYNHGLFREISERKEASFREMIRGRVQVLPGVRSLLEALNGANYPQAIASSAPQANIDAIIAELKLDSYFQAVISAEAMPSKPDPAVFLTAAKKLGVLAEKCVVIEDAIAGVKAARRGGMKCVAVTTTNRAQDLAAADLVVNRLDRLKVADLLALVG